MAGFDDPGVFVGDRYFPDEEDSDGVGHKLRLAKSKFREFLRTFHMGGFSHIYRDQLRQRYNLGEYFLEVRLDDLKSFDEDLEANLRLQPALYVGLFEEAATEVADEITKPRQKGDEEIKYIQIMLSSPERPSGLRSLKSDQVSQLVKIPGIVISASQVRSKAVKISIECRGCKKITSGIHIRPGLEGYMLPRRCTTDQTTQAQKCPMDPYFIIPDKCYCVDFQTLKLQENTQDVPHGEMPRHVQLFCDRYLTDRVAPGSRVSVLGIYSIKKTNQKAQKERGKSNIGIRVPYVRIVGIEVETSGLGRTSDDQITRDDEEYFRRLSREPDLYKRIYTSIAPSIWGSEDIKKAAACLLFGGSRKRLPDGIARRGDVNVLLLGDPGTAKSQLLKFVENVSPIGVYTSGKGSSAAGLTASVNRDPVTRTFVMEGGAMVLADGGVVCIDEFDKMNEDDRVAIHEAMEQQTISIAKAGIVTTLNSRCSVLAAANSVFGRWDETKGEDNIDFMPTILSRFDMIFLIKDHHNAERDLTLARHVIQVHMGAKDFGNQASISAEDGEISLGMLKKYIVYCKSKCAPRLSPEASDILRHRYVQMRAGLFSSEEKTKERSSIPITVRQLEAIVRISESLAKMELRPFATERHVEEALRLFKVSTLQAAQSGQLATIEGFATEHDQAMLTRVETQLKRRFAMGTQVSEHVIVKDFVKQGYPEHAVNQALSIMIRRGEIQHRLQRKMLYRLK